MTGLVSILVRCRNDAAFLTRTLEAIAAQDCPFRHEVLVCDDASTDGSAEILRARPEARLVSPPAGGYRPGRTLNALVRAAAGEIVVFNNADAVPLDAHWLANLIAPLAEGSADATFANQVPRPDATPLVRRDSLRAFGEGSSAWPRFFSLASAAARRDDLLANPFDEDLQYSEDVEWANRREGFRRRYVPTARVEHSHNYTRRQLVRRFYGEGYAETQIFGDPVPGLLRDLLAAGLDVARDACALVRARQFGLGVFGASIMRRLVQRLAAGRGRADAAHGRLPRWRSTEARSLEERANGSCAPGVRRVLFTGVDSAFGGGLERFALRAAEALRAKGCRVDVVDAVPRTLGAYDRVVMQKMPRSLADLRRLKLRYGARLRFYAHDHELYCLRRHYYDPFRRPCARFYAPIPCRVCAIVTRPKWIGRALTRNMVAFLDEMRGVRTFVQGAYMRRNLLACGFAPDRLRCVAPFWTDAVSAARTDFMPRNADGDRPLRILFVGQLVAGKGVRVLLEAVARLSVPHSLTVVGSGRDATLLRRRARAVANGDIRFVGWQTNVTPFLADADVVVVPSLWNEPFCMAGVEAFAAGVPVIAFNRGGIGDWLRDGETGLFADEPTAEALSRALAKAADPIRLAGFSRACVALVRANYSTERFLTGILS